MEVEKFTEEIKKLYPEDKEKLNFVELVKAVVKVYMQKNPGETGIHPVLFESIMCGLLTEDGYSMALHLDATGKEVIFSYNVKTGQGEFVLGEIGDGNLYSVKSGDVGNFPV